MKNIFLTLIFILTLVVLATAQSDIRKVDFNNFTYSPTCIERKLTVKKGEFSEEKKDDGFVERLYFDVEKPTYGDITGDGKEDAVIVSSCNTGGTGRFTEAYLYTISNSKPIRLAIIEGGDRGYGGIRSATILGREIVVDQNDAGTDGANCCADYAIKTHYKWNGKKLVRALTESRRKINVEIKLQFAKGTSQSVTQEKIDGSLTFNFSAKAGQTVKVTTDSKDVDISISGEEFSTEPKKSQVSVKLNKTGAYSIRIENWTLKIANVLVTIEIK